MKRETLFENTDFSIDFPEAANWDSINSPLLTCIAKSICYRINQDLRSENRNYVPGLRSALVTIARNAEIYHP